jgi:hypothetical protein
MLLASLVAPSLSFHFFAVIVVVLIAVCIVFWLLQKVPIPEPFNYVLWGVLALAALYLVFWLLEQV